MQAYQYQPLPRSSSIRVLILHPAAQASSALECDIITKDRLSILRDPHNKTFDAVSYVWGTGAHDIPLYCRSERTYLYISAVVDEMLRCLRKCHKERRLWVDAICLNQKDNQEKSIQVQQMGQIYHMAEKVHVWLGPAVASTPLAFAFLRTIVAKFEPTPGQAKSPTTEEILDIFEETLQHRNFQPVFDLLQKPWFTRRWTLQESFLARDVIVRCGGSKIPWHWFAKGFELIHGRCHELQSIKNDQSSLYALNIPKALQKPTDLLSLLWTFHMSECSDPRDRIYSLLGLVQNVEPKGSRDQEPLLPDYGLGVDSVYRGFVRQCISSHQFLQILFHVDTFGRLSDVDPEWPSWVPNWTRAREMRRNSRKATSIVVPSHVINTGAYKVHKIMDDVSFSAITRDTLLDPQPSEASIGNRSCLNILGRRFDNIVEIYDRWPESNNHDLLVKYLADWIHKEEILRLPDNGLSAKTMRRAVEKGLLFLITSMYFFGYAKQSFLQDAKEIKICSGLDPGHISRSRNEGLEYIGKCQRIAKIIYPIAENKGFFTSEQVHMKKHLDKTYKSIARPRAESRQELFDFLDDLSTMMREGKKQVITASFNGIRTESLKRRYWIAPKDMEMGDVIIDISKFGRIGALLRPVKPPSELYGRPLFRLVGLLWSFEGTDYEDHLDAQNDCRTKERFLIL